MCAYWIAVSANAAVTLHNKADVPFSTAETRYTITFKDWCYNLKSNSPTGPGIGSDFASVLQALERKRKRKKEREVRGGRILKAAWSDCPLVAVHPCFVAGWHKTDCSKVRLPRVPTPFPSTAPLLSVPLSQMGGGDFGVQCSHALSVGRGSCNFVWIIWKLFPAFYWLGVKSSSPTSNWKFAENVLTVAIHDVDEFVSLSEQTLALRNLALGQHLLLTKSRSSAVNGCHQNESPSSW